MPDFGDFVERTFWTAIAAAGGALSAPAVFDVTVWQSAGVAALTVVINAVTIYARQKAGE